jgi:hypothetical protein
VSNAARSDTPRFPLPWTLNEANDACFIVSDKNGQKALFQSLDDPKIAYDTIAERFQRSPIGSAFAGRNRLFQVWIFGNHSTLPETDLAGRRSGITRKKASTEGGDCSGCELDVCREFLRIGS